MENDPRALRDVRDRGGDRTRPRGRGSFINYYEDLGASTTPEGHASWKKSNDTFNKEIAENTSKLDEAQGVLDSAYREQEAAVASQPGLEGAANEAWATYQKEFVPIRVVNGNIVEATYMLPRAYTDTASMGLDQYYTSGWVDNGANFNIDVKMKGGGRRGQMLHDLYRNAVPEVKKTFYAKTIPSLSNQLNANQAALNENQGELDAAAATVREKRGQISAAVQERDRQQQVIKDNYQKRLGTIAEVFGGFKVERK